MQHLRKRGLTKVSGGTLVCCGKPMEKIEKQEDKLTTKSVKGTRTEKNLLTAFAGESQARNRYTFFASVVRGVPGMQAPAGILELLAENY